MGACNSIQEGLCTWPTAISSCVYMGLYVCVLVGLHVVSVCCVCVL